MGKRLRKVLFGLGTTALMLVVAAFVYVWTLDLDSQPLPDPATRPQDLAYLEHAVPRTRGRILAVVTSTATFGPDARKAGYELTELARAYWVFVANGFEVDIASPRGGEPPMRLDDELVAADYAFLNDPEARRKVRATLPLQQVDPTRYSAVYFVGGKGTMFDFRGNPAIARVVRQVYERGGVIGAVCHGPAALLDVSLADGRPLLAGRRVTGFTNAEELFLMKDARSALPFLLQDAMRAQGARFVEAPRYLDNTVTDGRLVTGQNPWSTWSVAEAMIRALGHRPLPRTPTGEELAVRVLQAYHAQGPDAARRLRARLPDADKRLLLLHAVIAAMDGQLVEAWRLQGLARQ